MAKRFSELTEATNLFDVNIFAIVQSLTSKKITAANTAKYMLRTSPYADVISTQSSSKDYTAAELEPDNRIFADSTGGDIILGFFNGSDRDGTRITIINVGSANIVSIELVSAGVTSYILNPGETIEILWDDTTGIWQIVSKQLNGAFNVIINSQEDFENTVERVAANQYKFKDSITTIYFDYSGGLLMSGVLSGGDSWGYLQTNNTKRLVMNPLTYIDFGQTQGYLEINTSNAILENVEIRGDKGLAVAAQRSFLLNANYVSFINCVVQKRLVNVAFAAFEGSATAFHNDSSFYLNCRVFDIDQNGAFALSAFKSCKNITRTFVNNMENLNATGSVILFDTCTNIVNSLIRGIDSASNSTLSIFKSCTNVNNFTINDIDMTGGGTGGIVLIDSCINVLNGNISGLTTVDDDITIFSGCMNMDNINILNIQAAGDIKIFLNSNAINNCSMDNIDSTASGCIVFSGCDIINNIKMTNIDSDLELKIFYDCNNVSNIIADTMTSGTTLYGSHLGKFFSNIYYDTFSAGGNLWGFHTCENVSNAINDTFSTTAGTIYGFFECDGIINSSLINITTSVSVYGMHTCNYIGDCIIFNITSSGNSIFGFYTCGQITNSIAKTLSYTGAGAFNVYGFNLCFDISNCIANGLTESGTGTADGFRTCGTISSCVSSSNGGYGYYGCNYIVASEGNNNGINGFHLCNEISGCNAINNTGNGYELCNQISASRADGNVDGFDTCNQISASISEDNTNDGFFTCRGLTSNYATGNTNYGFNTCRRMGFNRSNANGVGQYNLCYADTGTTDAVADAAVGGYNTTA